MKNARSLALAIACSAGAALAAPAALAHEAGDWIVRGGFHTVDPKSDNGDIVEVDSDTMVTFDATYFFNPNVGVEVLAALPFKHDISLVDGPRVGSTKHLPPTVSVVYSFMPDARIQPYVGAGVNYTIFFDEQTRGALDGTSLSLNNSVGLAGMVGVDIALDDRWFLNGVVRYIDIDTDAKLDGADLETVSIDPWAFGLNVGYKF